MKIKQIKRIIQTTDLNNPISVRGWVKTNRCSGNIGFIELADGSQYNALQIVYDSSLTNYQEISKVLNGFALAVTGKVILTPEGKQAYELKADSITILSHCDEDYPLQKKRHSYEFLRDIAHLRPRTNTFTALYRLRSTLAMAFHAFYQGKGFLYLNSPMVTTNDGEGAGESFIITTRSDGNYAKDIFGRKGTLTVTGQLNAEAFALGFGDVYTFGPVFRAERSNTPRHANEFWMIEPEMAFADLNDNMNNIEEAVKFAIKYVLEHCLDEMDFFNRMIDNTLLERLNLIVKTPFKRMSYTQGIEELIKAQKAGHKFEYNDVHWGMDLQSEHEKYLCEKVVNGPLFLTDYPKDIKAFYMRLNDDNKTVAAADLLVPKVGELVGASQREERYDYLVKRMDELKMDKEPLQWYLDLRRFGGVVHSGYGIGFDRFLMYITSMENIKDVIPFPRTPGNLKF